MFKIPMVDLAGQHAKIQQDITNALFKVQEHGMYINGPEVREFKIKLENYLGVKHAIPCANGTDALQIAIMALDLPQGSEIMVPTFNFISAAEAISLMGHIPVFIDSNPQTFNLDEKKLNSVLTTRTKAIIAVHLFGMSSNMQVIMDFARKNKLYVIEDNAQSLGTKVRFQDQWMLAGTVGDIGTTSFFPSKMIGCMGDGGALFTNNDEIASKALIISKHGMKEKYKYEMTGINSRLDSLQAAILNIKIDFLDTYIQKRQEAARRYDILLSDVNGIELPTIPSYSKHTYNQYTIQAQGGERDRLKTRLSELGIPSMIYYPFPLHTQKAFLKYCKSSPELGTSEKLSERVLSIPMHTELEPKTQDKIAAAIGEFYQK